MSESEHEDRLTARRGFSSLSLRTQLLLVINIPLVLLVAAFLVYDFRREMAERVREKKIALEEEAKTILPAVLQVRRYGVEDMQAYIDTVCARMRDDDSPGHHIAVAMPGQAIQAEAHHRASPEMFDALQRAVASPTSRAYVGKREIIAGTSQAENVTVFVSEEVAPLRRSAWSNLIRRAAGLLVPAVIMAVILNVVMMRFVTLPLERLVATVRQIASGKLGVQSKRASSAELRFLSDEINMMSRALAKADEYRALQMAKARDIQRHALPEGCQVAGLDLSTVFEPADEVGGDFFDVIELPNNHVLVCVADVSGHGVAAAMSTMLLRALLRTAAELHDSPSEIMTFVNRRFTDATLLGDFATAIVVRLDLSSRYLEYVNAGHEPGILLSANGHQRMLESSGLVLGVDEDVAYTSCRYTFESGDRLLLVTDGVTETQGPDDQLFGRQRTRELLQESAQLAIREVTRKLNHELKQFRQGKAPYDDVTIVLLEVQEN